LDSSFTGVPATLTVSNSTLSDNSAPYGGALAVDTGSTATVNNSTLSRNTGEYGGALNNGGTVTVNNSTLSDNSATTTGDGGAIANAYGVADSPKLAVDAHRNSRL
jgi:hypothetical protein